MNHRGLKVNVIFLLAGIFLSGACRGAEGEAPSPIRSFLEIASDSKSTAAQQNTISILIKSTKETSAEAAFKKLGASKEIILYGGEDFISDLTPLIGFTDVETLVLYNNHVSDLTPLSKLTNLKTLRLELNKITDISSLRFLKKLESLQVTDNQISDISAISEMKDLRTLWISDNKIEDVSALAGLNSLADLYLSGNPVKDLAPLTKTSISDLRLQNCGLGDISALKGLNQDIEAFITLDLSNNQITNITPLAELHQVGYLDLSDNRISDISSLKNRNLNYLDLRNNRIADISPLTNLPALGSIDIRGNPIKDYRPLVDLMRLRSGIQIVADAGFADALKQSVPAKKELEKSPLVGHWLSDPIKTDEFGTVQIEMNFEDNGQCSQWMRGALSDGAPLEPNAANPLQRGTYRIESNVLITDYGEQTKQKFEIRDDTLTFESEQGSLKLARIKKAK